MNYVIGVVTKLAAVPGMNSGTQLEDAVKVKSEARTSRVLVVPARPIRRRRFSEGGDQGRTFHWLI